MSVLIKTFRENLKVVRRARNLTSFELSEQAMLRHKKRVADIEDGRGIPHLEEYVAICDVLNVRLEEMLKLRAKIKIEFQNTDQDVLKNYQPT